MKITCTQVAYKNIQNRAKLLILAEDENLSLLVESKEIFLINKKRSIFGVYLCKQRCGQTTVNSMKNIDYRDWDQFKPDTNPFLRSFIA